NPRKEAAVRDTIFTLSDPFSGTAAKLVDLPLRYRGVDWGSDDLALVDSRRFKDRKEQMWRIHPNGTQAAVLIFDRSYEDRYGDPGQPVTRRNASGQEVLRIAPDGHTIFFIGEGASPEGARPFVDRIDINTKNATRLFRSNAPYYELPVDVLD